MSVLKPKVIKVKMHVYDFDVPNEQVWHDKVQKHVQKQQVKGWGLQTWWHHNGRYQFSMIHHGDEDTRQMKQRRKEALKKKTVTPVKEECLCLNCRATL